MEFLPKKVDSQFLIRIIMNEVSTEEREYFERWRAESDSNKEDYGNLLLIWEQMGTSNQPQTPDPELQWAKIENKISAKEIKTYNFKTAELRESKAGKNIFGVWILRAAAMLILTIISVIAYQNLTTKKALTPNNSAGQFNPLSETLKYELVAQRGQRITFPLSDGSIIYLNSDSKLIYPKYFADDSRELEVIGEAYFSVKPDKKRPFKVKSGEITTLVTGTEFNITNRGDRVEVVVASGTVKVSSKNSSGVFELTKGEKVEATSGIIQRKFATDLKHELAWRENKLSFSNTKLKDIMYEIERVYNVSVFFKNDSLKTRSLTGVFETRSLESILSLINLTLDISVKQRGSIIIVE